MDKVYENKFNMSFLTDYFDKTMPYNGPYTTSWKIVQTLAGQFNTRFPSSTAITIDTMLYKQEQY